MVHISNNLRWTEFPADSVFPITAIDAALAVDASIGIDHSQAKSNHLDDFKDWNFDYVISLCDNADKNCPVFLGGVTRTHIGFENPDAAAGNEEERIVTFRRVRDQIRKQIPEYLTGE